MVSNKEHSNSRKLYQQILGYKGKIAIYSEYIDFYRDNLEEKTNKKRTEIVSKYKEILDGFEFHLKSDDEIYALIETKDVKEKAAAKVFDCSTFKVNGANLTTYLADTDGDYKGESEAIAEKNGVKFFN